MSPDTRIPVDGSRCYFPFDLCSEDFQSAQLSEQRGADRSDLRHGFSQPGTGFRRPRLGQRFAAGTRRGDSTGCKQEVPGRAVGNRMPSLADHEPLGESIALVGVNNLAARSSPRHWEEAHRRQLVLANFKGAEPCGVRVVRRSLMTRKPERMTPSASAFRLHDNRDVRMPGTRARNGGVFPDWRVRTSL
jgi:hypothetical protein